MDGLGKVHYSNGMRYAGQFRKYKRHGQGIATVPDGTRYDCEWCEGERQGAGSEHWADGTVFRGFYDRNQRSGRGVMTWPEAARYDGEFKAGNAHGHGQLVRADGTVFTGQFVDDTMHGEGHMVWSGGVAYNGQFVKNARHGFGLMTWTTGRWTSYSGQWKNGKQHGSGILIDAETGKEFCSIFNEGLLERWDDIEAAESWPDQSAEDEQRLGGAHILTHCPSALRPETSMSSTSSAPQARFDMSTSSRPGTSMSSRPNAPLLRQTTLASPRPSTSTSSRLGGSDSRQSCGRESDASRLGTASHGTQHNQSGMPSGADRIFFVAKDDIPGFGGLNIDVNRHDGSAAGDRRVYHTS